MAAVKPVAKSHCSLTFLCIITKGFGEQGFLIWEATSGIPPPATQRLDESLFLQTFIIFLMQLELAHVMIK